MISWWLRTNSGKIMNTLRIMSLSIESRALHQSTTRPKNNSSTILLSLRIRRITITREAVIIIHSRMVMDTDELIPWMNLKMIVLQTLRVKVRTRERFKEELLSLLMSQIIFQRRNRFKDTFQIRLIYKTSFLEWLQVPPQ